MTERALRAGMLALALALFPGCEVAEEDPVGPPEVDLAPLADVVDSANVRLESLTFALDRVADASDVLARDGVDLDVLGAGPGAAASARLEPEEIPQSAHGSVYVRNASTHAYERDPERTDGPADGIRILHYRRVASGEFLIPLSEAGSVDVTQADPAEERYVITLRDADGGTLLEFTAEGEDTQARRVRDFEGTVDGDPPVTFSLVSQHEAFSQASAAMFQGTLQTVGVGGLQVHWDRYLQEESEQTEAFQEGGFTFELNGEGGAYVSGFVQFVSDGGGANEIEGHIGVGSVNLVVSGTLAAPTFEAAEGSDDLSASDRALLGQIWAELIAFIDAWWVPIGS